MEQGKITYVGWVGHDNLGDEALYQSNKKLFNPYRLVPDNNKQHSKITLFGGGTLLPYWSRLVMPNKYNYAYGVGVRNPSFWEKTDPFINQVKNFNFRFLGVRGNTSKKLLRDWGIDSKVIGDPCLLLSSSTRERENKKIAINVGSDGLVWGGGQERVFVEVAKLCKVLKRDRYNPILIAFSKDDVPHIKEISKITNTNMFEGWRSTKRTLDLIASSYILIGERLHSIIFSAATHTPFISLEYRPKCQDFAETVGFEKYCIRTDKMTSEKVMALVYSLSENWTEMHEELVKKVKKYCKELREFADEIKKDIQSLPSDKWSVSPSQNVKCAFHLVKRWVEYGYMGIRYRKKAIRFI